MSNYPRAAASGGSRAPLRTVQPPMSNIRALPPPTSAVPPPPGSKPAAPAGAKPGKLSAQHSSPPRVIKRPPSSSNLKGQSSALQRGVLLGEGGFARVYAVSDPAEGTKHALKVIAKSQLKSSKNKAKLFAEIKLHQSLEHKHIVGFETCFEDEGSVYMQLELCEHGSLLDLLRQRKRYSEPETRLLLLQLLSAISHLHSSSIIHRDLKLGNLLFSLSPSTSANPFDTSDTGELNVKVADFGLAALVKFKGERKKTICGTPNYIAPEILFDQANGHSFEVDIWSVGVILYTLLLGKPPFQTKDVKSIYMKIKSNAYTFPASPTISPQAQNLISSILATDPNSRPSLLDIVESEWMTCGPFPAKLDRESLEREPNFSQLNGRESERNYWDARRRLGLLRQETQDAMSSLRQATEGLSLLPSVSEAGEPTQTSRGTKKSSRTATITVPDGRNHQRLVEAEARSAVSSHSPIAELLRSARKPLYVSPRRQTVERDETELGTSTRAERRRERGGGGGGGQRGEGDVGKFKARIVSGMCEEGSPRKALGSRKEALGTDSKLVRSQSAKAVASSTAAKELYTACYNTLAQALQASTPSSFERLGAPPKGYGPPKVFISSWVDYTHKYGTAYALTDGSAGLYFNDSSSMVLAADENHFDYISWKNGHVYTRRSYTLNPATYPEELERKTYLMNYFHDYMAKTLQRDVDWNWKDLERVKHLDFLAKYYRMKDAIVFKLSNDVIQINFWDHQKLILTHNATCITFIDPNLSLKTYAIADLFKEAYKLGLFEEFTAEEGPGETAEERKKEKRKEKLAIVLAKLEYAREVLKSLVNRATKQQASAQAAAEAEAEAE